MLTLEKNIPQVIARNNEEFYRNNSPTYDNHYTFNGFEYDMSKADAELVLSHFEQEMNFRAHVDQHYGMIGCRAVRSNEPFTFNAVMLFHHKHVFDCDTYKYKDVVILCPAEVSVNNYGYIQAKAFGITRENTFGIKLSTICTADSVKDGEINLDGARNYMNRNTHMQSCRVFLSTDNLSKSLSAIFRQYTHEARKEDNHGKHMVSKALTALGAIA